jgi:hypothetical protein
MAAELNGPRLPPRNGGLGQKGLTIAATANAIKTIRALAAKYSPMGMASSPHHTSPVRKQPLLRAFIISLICLNELYQFTGSKLHPAMT